MFCPKKMAKETQFGFSKKFKSLISIDPAYGFVGFLLFISLGVSCFFYLEHESFAGVLSSYGVSFAQMKYNDSSSSSSSSCKNERVGFLDQSGDKCNIFEGNWVWDQDYPLYLSQNCSLLENGYRCSENKRPDNFYTKWRWQPKDCNLPRFDAGKMLEKLRNKRVVFVGDSIGRNQWASLLCMLSTAISNKSSIYEVNGNPITKHTRFLIFKFESFNCTVEYYRSPFLVVQSHPPFGAPKEVRYTLKLDKITWTSSSWRDADLVILNSGHWWTDGKTVNVGTFFEEGDELKMNMSVGTAFRRAIETVFNWIGTEMNMEKTIVFFRSYSPAHFRGGNWNTGGRCHLETLPDLGSFTISEPHNDIIMDVLAKRSHDPHVKKLDILSVTRATMARKDGHISIYKSWGLSTLNHQDCSHWCLPGVPDTWNELLYARFLKHELNRA